MKNYRIEKDSMGEVKVPLDALWGAQTQRAINNFQISNRQFPECFVKALGVVKYCAADANFELGLLDKDIADLIKKAAKEIYDGKFQGQFVLDIFQTGSGTSTNMNANEVIANYTNRLSDGKIKVHPNDHVNRGQSSNDIIPTTIHIAAAERIEKILKPALIKLKKALSVKADEFSDVVKIGRTHLQDATPVTLGQEFQGFADQVKKGLDRLDGVMLRLLELPIGGTAVGSGINTHKDFAWHVCRKLAEITGIDFREAANHFEAQGAMDALVETSSILKTVAVSLYRIANEIRWMGSGPRCGFGEIKLPELQPGSSIMPGKVNPVMSEMLIQVSAQVIGNDSAITLGGLGGNFELNVMMPLIASNLLESIAILSTGAEHFTEKCVNGIEANVEVCKDSVEKSLAMCTSLTPVIGYDKAAEIAKTAYETGKTVRQVVKELNLLSDEQIDKLLDPLTMIKPNE